MIRQRPRSPRSRPVVKMNELSLSLDHGLHSGEWDPSTSDGTNIVRFHVRQALAAVDFLRARARADNHTTDSASASAERDQATQPYLERDASGRGQNIHIPVDLVWYM